MIETEGYIPPPTPAPSGKITQTLEQFLAKYKDAIDANGNFIPGKANLFFDGKNAAQVYRDNIGSHEIDVRTSGEDSHKEWTPFNSEVNADWIPDPRGKGGFVGNMVSDIGSAAVNVAKQTAPLWMAAAGANYLPGLLSGGTAGTAAAAEGAAAGTAAAEGYGVGSSLSAATGAAAGTGAAVPSASGLAGALGMNAGMGATALNTGALNAGVSLATGHTPVEALRAGAGAALMSPVGGIASNAVGGGTIGRLAAGAATGGAGAALTGGNIASGIGNGLLSSGVSLATDAAGKFASKELQDSGVSKNIGDSVGRAASAVTGAALTGRDIGSTLTSNIIGQGLKAGMDELTPQKPSGLINAFSGPIDTNDISLTEDEKASGGYGSDMAAGYLGTANEIEKGNNVGNNTSYDDFLSIPDYDRGAVEETRIDSSAPPVGWDETSDGKWVAPEPVYQDPARTINEIVPDDGTVGERYQDGVTRIGGESPAGVSDTLAGSGGMGGAASTTTVGQNWIDRLNGSIKSMTGIDLSGGIKSISEWAEKNKVLSDMIAKGIASASAAQSKLDQINLLEQKKIEANQRFSDSVKGLNGGLLSTAQSPLTRRDGSRVFSGGLLSRG